MSRRTEPRDEPANRDGTGRDVRTGRFLPGNKANPSGRPATPKEVADFFASHTIEAAEAVVAMMREGDPQDRLRAAFHVLDRSLGRPAQAIDITARAEPAGVGGNPDRARAELERLIAAAEATETNQQTVALDVAAQEGRAVAGGHVDAVASGLPDSTGEGTP